MLNIKSLTKNIKDKKVNGNISILVILILLASSVISLLAINQIQHLMTYGNQTFDYFRAYYLAKAGTELGLTEVYNRGDGFNMKIGSGDAIVSGNLLKEFSEFGGTLTGDLSGFEPYFTVDVTGSFVYLTNDVKNSNNCTEDNKIVLGSGDGIVISLFEDNTTERFAPSEHSKYDPVVEKLVLKPESTNISNLTFGYFSFDKKGDMVDAQVYNGKIPSIEKLNEKFQYISIKNSGEDDVEFCVYANGILIPSSNSLITVRGHYGDMEVGLQSVIKGTTPSWALNVLGIYE